MLKLEEILCAEGLEKVFYHKDFGDTKFSVIYEKGVFILIHLIDEEDWEMTAIGSDLLDGFYTKE